MVPLNQQTVSALLVKDKLVHIAAVLITLSDVTPEACTSMRCAWSRPSQKGKALLANDLEGFFPWMDL